MSFNSPLAFRLRVNDYNGAMPVRISADSLPPEALRALSEGDVVEFERDGELIGTMAPCKPPFSWERYIEQRRKARPLDYDDFLKDLEMIREELNTPIEPAWPS